MSSETGPLPSRYTQSHSVTTRAKNYSSLVTPTIGSVERAIKQEPETSLVTLSQDLTHQVLKHHENLSKFSSSLLKNKNLLVQRRLAIRRQRATLKGSSLQFEPIRSGTLQLELGLSREPTAKKNREDTRPTNTPEYDRIKSTSNQNSSLKDEMLPSLPTDISLLYKEKPPSVHPVTGQLILQYLEKDDSPSPCSYVLPRKSYREKTAPAYSFGRRCFVERQGGSRTAWQKQWFANSNPFTLKVDFNRENSWPTPCHYYAAPTLGFQTTKPTFPAWSFGANHPDTPTLLLDQHPSPDAYDTAMAFKKVTAKTTQITFKSRVGGTQIDCNQSISVTPGPGAHDESKFLSNRRSSPKHSFGKRIPASLRQDPYVNVTMPLRT